MPSKHITVIERQWQKDNSNIPLSAGVRVGNTIYVSGQIARGPDGKIVGIDNLAIQTRQCFENIRVALAQAGGAMLDVVKLTTYFSCDLTHEVAAKYWSVREEFFGDYRPASTGVQVKALVYPEVLLEIEAVAVVAD